MRHQPPRALVLGVRIRRSGEATRKRVVRPREKCPRDIGLSRQHSNKYEDVALQQLVLSRSSDFISHARGVFWVGFRGVERGAPPFLLP